MGFYRPILFALFNVAVVVSHAAVTPELYWNKVLPGTSMPKAIRESLNPGRFFQGVALKNKNTFIPSRKFVVDVYIKWEFPTAELKDLPNVALFFLETDLVPGKTFNLQLGKASGPASFLPREMVDSIPFSSHDTTDILNRFSINPESEEANFMRQTIRDCEEPGSSGEQKYCATSLESMIDFSTKILGKKNVKAVSTESNEDTKVKSYKIEDNVKTLTGDAEINALSVVCHKLAYVYAVFYCHSFKPTKIYLVPLKSEDGTQAKTIAVCHEDTSKWNPKHLSFQITKVKPGTVPICHFLAGDTVAWYRN